MARVRYTAGQIIGMLREAELSQARGSTAPQACKQIRATEQTYYRWRREYEALKVEQAMRLKELEKENSRLRRAVPDFTVDKLILAEATMGNF